MLGSYHLIAQSRKHLDQIPHSMTCGKIMRESERNERLFKSSTAPFFLCFSLNTEEKNVIPEKIVDLFTLIGN